MHQNLWVVPLNYIKSPKLVIPLNAKYPSRGDNDVPVDETMVNSKIANVLRVSKKISNNVWIFKKNVFLQC